MEVRKIGNTYVATYRAGRSIGTAPTFWEAVVAAFSKADGDRVARIYAAKKARRA